MIKLNNLIILVVLAIVSVSNAARLIRQTPFQQGDISQFGLFVGDDQIVRRNPNFPSSTGGQIVQQSQQSITTTTTVSPPTTASPQYLDCLARCPATQEYNPVCGTDMINYQNDARLTCAQRCGKNVQRVRLGTCLPLG